MKKVFVFPGSGSQRPGMIKLLKSYMSEVRDIFDMASDISHIDVIDLCTTKPEDVLHEAMNTQMSVTAMNLSFLKLLFNRGIEPDIVLGESLGEFSALAASKAMSFEDVMRLVYTRASMISGIKTPSRMYVSLGLPLNQVKEGIAKIPKALGKVEIGVINSDTQIVMGGPVEALNALADILKDMGVYKVEHAKVDHGFHTSYMKEMEEKYSAYIDTLKVNDPVHSIILNCSAQFGYTAQDIITDIKRQCCHTVLWNDSLKLLYSVGELLIAEVGTGKTIANIIVGVSAIQAVYFDEITRLIEPPATFFEQLINFFKKFFVKTIPLNEQLKKLKTDLRGTDKISVVVFVNNILTDFEDFHGITINNVCDLQKINRVNYLKCLLHNLTSGYF